jgi:hypothetical protein
VFKEASYPFFINTNTAKGMLIKKYEAIGLIRLETFVMVKGKRVDLRFTPGVMYYNKWASISISDKNIQDALEQTQMFKQGRLRVINVTEKLEPPTEVKIIKEGENKSVDTVMADNGVLEFDNLKALQVYLMKNHRISFTEIRSRENAIAKSNELGIEVKIKNN